MIISFDLSIHVGYLQDYTSSTVLPIYYQYARENAILTMLRCYLHEQSET